MTFTCSVLIGVKRRNRNFTCDPTFTFQSSAFCFIYAIVFFPSSINLNIIRWIVHLVPLKCDFYQYFKHYALIISSKSKILSQFILTIYYKQGCFAKSLTGNILGTTCVICRVDQTSLNYNKISFAGYYVVATLLSCVKGLTILKPKYFWSRLPFGRQTFKLNLFFQFYILTVWLMLKILFEVYKSIKMERKVTK